MIGLLLRKEILANLRTARLGLAMVFTLVLTALATGMGSVGFSHNWAHYESRSCHCGYPWRWLTCCRC